MKKNELNEVKNLDIKALGQRVAKLRAEISDAVMDKHMNSEKNTKKMRNMRKDLAQLLTIVRQKELLNVLESAGAEKGANS